MDLLQAILLIFGGVLSGWVFGHALGWNQGWRESQDLCEEYKRLLAELYGEEGDEE